MKKILIALFALVMLITLAACNSNAGSETTAATTTAAEEATTPAPSSGNTEEETTFAPSIFDDVYAANKDKDLSFIEAAELVEELVVMPEFDENGKNFKITLDAELKATSSAGATSADVSIPASFNLIATKEGTFSAELFVNKTEVLDMIFDGEAIYLVVTDLDTDETVSIKFAPTDEEFAQLTEALAEIMSSFNPESLFPSFGEDGEDGEDAESFYLTFMEALSAKLEEFASNKNPEQISEQLLGKGKLSFNDDHTKFYVSAVGGFDSLNGLLGEIAGVIDSAIPEEFLEELDGTKFADVFGAFKVRSNSNLLDCIFDAQTGAFCGFAVDIGIEGTDTDMADAMGIKGASADITLNVGLTIDDNLKISAPDSNVEYTEITVDMILEMLEEMLGSFGGNKEEVFPDDGFITNPEKLGLIPDENGIIHLSTDVALLPEQINCINALGNEYFDGIVFHINGKPFFTFPMESSTGYYFTVSYDVSDEDLTMVPMIPVMSDAELTIGETVDIYCTYEVIIDEFDYESFVFVDCGDIFAE